MRLRAATAPWLLPLFVWLSLWRILPLGPISDADAAAAENWCYYDARSGQVVDLSGAPDHRLAVPHCIFCLPPASWDLAPTPIGPVLAAPSLVAFVIAAPSSPSVRPVGVSLSAAAPRAPPVFVW